MLSLRQEEILLSLLKEIKTNLEEMKRLNIIERMRDELIDRCFGLVLVLKPDRKIRMCIDYVLINI